MVKASSFMNWCTENISPQAWARLCLKCSDEVRGKGHDLKKMQDLSSEILLDDELLAALNKSLRELYDMQPSEKELLTA